MLISEETAERKGLLNKVDKTTRVTLSQAEKAKKLETYGVVQGGVSYKMMSKHGRLVTVTLPCHMAPVQRDLIGANEQGPILQGIKGVMYLEYTRPDGRRGTCMIMPDGEIVPLPADSSGLTMFPEIGQEKHWARPSYPLEIEELCELLMSRERVRRLRKDMPDPTSDSVLPTTNELWGSMWAGRRRSRYDAPAGTGGTRTCSCCRWGRACHEGSSAPSFSAREAAATSGGGVVAEGAVGCGPRSLLGCDCGGGG